MNADKLLEKMDSEAEQLSHKFGGDALLIKYAMRRAAIMVIDEYKNELTSKLEAKQVLVGWASESPMLDGM